MPAYNESVNSFRKGNWNRACFLFKECVVRLPPPDTTNIEKAATSGHNKHREGTPGTMREPLLAAKQSISRGVRKNYMTCWDRECETLYRSFFRAPAGLILTEPLRLYFCRYTKKAKALRRNCPFHGLFAL